VADDLLAIEDKERRAVPVVCDDDEGWEKEEEGEMMRVKKLVKYDAQMSACLVAERR